MNSGILKEVEKGQRRNLENVTPSSVRGGDVRRLSGKWFDMRGKWLIEA